MKSNRGTEKTITVQFECTFLVRGIMIVCYANEWCIMQFAVDPFLIYVVFFFQIIQIEAAIWNLDLPGNLSNRLRFLGKDQCDRSWSRWALLWLCSRPHRRKDWHGPRWRCHSPSSGRRRQLRPGWTHCRRRCPRLPYGAPRAAQFHPASIRHRCSDGRFEVGPEK